MRNPIRIYIFLTSHPLNKGKKFQSVVRYIKWQLASYIMNSKVAVPFVNDSRLFIRRGLHSANANYYTGLDEFHDMAFLLHALRKGDQFVDVGANVGTYSILASAVCGTELHAFEPTPETFAHLRDNLALNGMSDRSHLHNKCVGAEIGVASFTIDNQQPTKSHVASAESSSTNTSTIQVPTTTLDVEIMGDPFCIKIDVEGFESAVIDGASKLMANPALKIVLMETNGLGSGLFGLDDDKLHTQMLSLGFLTFDYDPFNRRLISLDGGTNSTGNTLYIRDIPFVESRLKNAPSFRVHGWEI